MDGLVASMKDERMLQLAFKGLGMRAVGLVASMKYEV